MTRVTITALLAAGVTGCIAGIVFAATVIPTSGAVIMGGAVTALLIIVHAALWIASGP